MIPAARPCGSSNVVDPSLQHGERSAGVPRVNRPLASQPLASVVIGNRTVGASVNRFEGERERHPGNLLQVGHRRVGSGGGAPALSGRRRQLPTTTGRFFIRCGGHGRGVVQATIARTKKWRARLARRGAPASATNSNASSSIENEIAAPENRWIDERGCANVKNGLPGNSFTRPPAGSRAPVVEPVEFGDSFCRERTPVGRPVPFCRPRRQ